MLRRLTYGDHDAFQIFHYIIIGKSEHAISAGRKPSIATVIVTNTLLEIVALAVDLNDELAGVRDKVCDIVADRTLPAKAQSG